MAVSMAAALSANLPAPVAAPSPATGSSRTIPAHEAIPKELKGGLDVESSVPVTEVGLDGMVVIKILKHAHDALSADCSGQLLGLDLNGTLEVSDSFPFPALPASERGADEDKERAAARTANAAYASEMLRSLRQISATDSVVGAYFSSPSGAFLKGSLVDAQSIYQTVGGRKGLVIAYDPTKSTQGTISLRAFRFSPAFAAAHAKGKFDTQSLVEHKITFSNILQELPIRITNSALVNAFLATLSLPALSTSSSTSTSSFLNASATLPPSLSALSLSLPQSLTSSLEHTSRALDDYRREFDSLSYNAREIARNKSKYDGLLNNGVPEDEARRIVRVPAEASRLQSLLLLAQVDEFAKGMATAASGGVARLYGTTSTA